MLVGVDWGGTKIEAIALGEDGEQVARVRESTPCSDYEGCLALIARLVAQVETTAGRTGTVGVGLPGSLDPRTGLAKGASFDLAERPRRRGRPASGCSGRDVRTSNDADCFAVSEAVDGAGAGHRVVFGVILGTGAGAGIAVDGRAHHGPNNSAGEWGHNLLPRPDVTEIPGPACYCGRHGCLERWVSGPRVRPRLPPARQRRPRRPAPARAPRRSSSRSAPATGWPGWSGTATSTGWPAGSRSSSTPSTRTCSCIGGGMSNIPELYDELPGRLADATFSPCFYTPILPAAHGDSSGVRGAAWLWKD